MASTTATVARRGANSASTTTTAAGRRARVRCVRRPYPVSYRIFVTSPEVWLGALTTLFSYTLLMTVASDTRVTGPGGSWSSTSQRSLRHLQSREAELQADPPARVSVDLVLICACVLAVNVLIGACVRVLLKEKRRIETEVQRQAKAATGASSSSSSSSTENGAAAAAVEAAGNHGTAPTVNGPAHAHTANDGSGSNAAALTEASSALVGAGGATKGGVEYYFDEDMITNVLVAIGLVYSLLAAVFVQLQAANETRGYGAVAPMVLLVGAIVCPRMGDGLLTVQHYCGVVYGLTLMLLLFLLARSAVSNAARPPRLLAYLVGMA